MMEFFDPWVGDDLEFEIAQSCTGRRRRTALRNFERKIAVMEIGRSVCFGGKGGGGGGAPAPDPQIGQAAVMNAQTGQQWLEFARDQFDQGNLRQEEMDELTKTVIDQQLATQEQQSEWALEDRTRYKEKFQPLQDEFIETAKNYDSAERQAQVASEAKADVLKSADTQTQINQRQMASMGINPASGRFAGITRASDTNTALAAAGAQNAARTALRDKAIALKADAINMGNGLPSQSAAAASLGLNAGNSAVGNSATGQNSYYQNRNVMAQGFGGTMQGYANQANILGDLYGKQVSAWSANQQANATSSAGVGALVGTLGAAALMSSDIRIKQDIVPIGRMKSGIPVYIYRYKPEFRDECGYGYFHGVMAQDVEKVLPDAVVTRNDGRKMVNYGMLH